MAALELTDAVGRTQLVSRRRSVDDEAAESTSIPRRAVATAMRGFGFTTPAELMTMLPLVVAIAVLAGIWSVEVGHERLQHNIALKYTMNHNWGARSIAGLLNTLAFYAPLIHIQRVARALLTKRATEDVEAGPSHSRGEYSAAQLRAAQLLPLHCAAAGRRSPCTTC